MTDLPTDLVSPRQAAERLGVNRRTIYRWIENGKLAAWDIAGTLVRVRLADVLALVQRRVRRVVPAAEPTSKARALRNAYTAAVLREAGFAGY